MNFDDLFYYLNYGRTRKQKKRDLMFLRTLFFIKLATLILMIVIFHFINGFLIWFIKMW